MAGETETLQDLQDILSGDDDSQDEKDIKVGDPEDDDDDLGNEDDEDSLEGTNEDKDNKEGSDNKEDEEKVNTLKFKEVTKKYPNLFKDFPDLRHKFFHEEQYRELFPSIEEAKEALEEVEGFRELETSLKSGTVQDTEGILESIKELGADVVANFADNFLPALQKIDQDTYFRTITPLLVQSVRNLYDSGIQNENENFQNAALVMAKYLFGDMKVASGEKEVKLSEKPGSKGKGKDTELENERAQFRNERYTTFLNDVTQTSNSQITSLIENGLDPKNAMPSGMKRLIVREVAEEISKVLGANSTHKSKMNSLWKKAGDGNFQSNWKSKILSAYLEAAEEVMPRIRSKIRAEALGIRERRPENNGDKDNRRREPKSTVSNGRSSNSQNKGKELNAKNIDWKKTSDIDLFNDKVTMKS